MNKSKLRAYMIEHNDTQESLARALGISLSRFNAKLNEYCGAEFKQNEIAFIKERYSLNPMETDAIFFANKMS